MAVSAILGSLLFFVSATWATAHNDEVVANTSRRLTWFAASQPIWGGCEAALGAEGCTLNNGFKCSDRLSAGPDDADVEIKIRGLPSSTAEEPVHLHFWSPRKSPTQYEPLVSLVGCSVYNDMLDAYPRYDAVDFNGGNVRVSENGEATIRVRTPATYMFWWEGGFYEVPVPHIHLRLCYGGDFTQTPAHGIYFSEGITWLASTNTPLLELVSLGPYVDRSTDTPVDENAPIPPKVIAGALPPSQRTTTLSLSSTTFITTTDADDNGVLINAARDALDLDALEFSPVYLCLLEGAFFDHFSSSCSAECGDDAVVKHGQCARPETDDAIAELAVTWKLEINCGEPCWHEKKLVSLHHVRLSVATLLFIPFQEVEVDMGFLASGSRRLSGAKTGYLTVKVVSNRMTAEAGAALLQDFVKSTDFISKLLGLEVLAAEVVEKPDGQFLSEPVKMDPDNDPYEPAYSALEPGLSGGGTSGVLSFLPTPAIVGIAAGVIVLLGAFLAIVWWRRRAQRSRDSQQRAEQKVNEIAADPEEPKAPAAESQEQNGEATEDPNAI